MGRYVYRGTKGIALIDTSGDNPRLKYVFDVADTGGREHSRRPVLWTYQEEHQEAVSAALFQRYEVDGENGLADQLERIAAQLVDAYWNDHQYSILSSLDNSFLEGYDDFNVGVAFRNAAVVSTTYVLLSRCGLDPDQQFTHEDFLSVFDFNTRDTLAALGTAISSTSEQVLRQIEVTIKNHMREKHTERSQHHERTDLRDEGGLFYLRIPAENSTNAVYIFSPKIKYEQEKFKWKSHYLSKKAANMYGVVTITCPTSNWSRPRTDRWASMAGCVGRTCRRTTRCSITTSS
jgi:hypothetical protein